jgi:trehalose 6-phosphate synthase
MSASSQTAPRPSQHPLIIASNRGPVTFRIGDGGGLLARRGGGGLVTALSGLARYREVTWIAHAMTDGDVRAMQEASGAGLAEVSRDGHPYTLHLVGQPDDDFERHYAVLANPLLWFVQHRLYGFGDEPTITRTTYWAWESYVRINRRIADRVVAEATRALEAGSTPVVMVHDYHLMLVPGMVRAALPTVHISYFHHVPWPDAGAWRCVPEAWTEAILESLMTADIAGLQTDRDAGHLQLAINRCVSRRDAATNAPPLPPVRCRVRHYPISVAVDEFEEHVGRASVRRLRERIAALRPADGSLVVRVDRTDPSKNIVRGFAAWALLLHEHPELHGKVTMFCQLDPSRQEVPEYARYFRRLMAEAGSINAAWGSGSWQPLVLNTDPDFAAAVAAYCEYDVLYVNPVADGMNLVSKEGPLVNERDGVVVLSQQAGSFRELGDHVIPINPFDVAQQADALYAAITRNAADRAADAAALREQVRTNDITRWIDLQLADLADIVPRVGAQH